MTPLPVSGGRRFGSKPTVRVLLEIAALQAIICEGEVLEVLVKSRKVRLRKYAVKTVPLARLSRLAALPSAIFAGTAKGKYALD